MQPGKSLATVRLQHAFPALRRRLEVMVRFESNASRRAAPSNGRRLYALTIVAKPLQCLFIRFNSLVQPVLARLL